MKETLFQDVRVIYDDKELEFSNSCFRCIVDLTATLFKTKELSFANGKKIAVQTESDCDADLGFMFNNRLHEWHFDRCDVVIKKDSDFEGDCVSATLTYSENFSNTVVTREYFIYPHLAVFGMQNSITSPVRPQGGFNIRKTLTDEYNEHYKCFLNMSDDDLEPEGEPIVSTIHPLPDYKITQCIEFAGHTDVHNTPVRAYIAKAGEKRFTGNVLYCEDDEEAGFMVFQEAPPSSERREAEEYDFRLANNGDILSLCWGVNPDEMTLNERTYSYRNAVGVFNNSYERDRLIKNYLRVRYNYGQERFAVVCNAWGCGNFGERLSHQFVKDEIYAAAECGAEIYQIDDNWQFGKLQDITTSRKNIELRKYWSVNQETMGCDSFVPFTEYAKEAGIGLALWMAPSVMFDYADYEEFSDMLVEFCKLYDFKIFKLDGAKFGNYQAERNFEKLLETARKKSGKEIFFNLDVTAGMRGGYFKFLNHGNLFLENRFVNHHGTIAYHPELTLRNIWNLSKYVRLQSIQAEVPYFGDLDLKKRTQVEDVTPDAYSWEFWMAIAFFANPLLWFAPSTVKKEDRPRVARMLALYRKYRKDIFAGDIMPVGSEPGSESLSGLVSETDGRAGFIALYRGINSAEDSFATDGEWDIIAGNAEFCDGKIIIPEKAGFAILKRR